MLVLAELVRCSISTFRAAYPSMSRILLKFFRLPLKPAASVMWGRVSLTKDSDAGQRFCDVT